MNYLKMFSVENKMVKTAMISFVFIFKTSLLGFCVGSIMYFITPLDSDLLIVKGTAVGAIVGFLMLCSILIYAFVCITIRRKVENEIQ